MSVNASRKQIGTLERGSNWVLFWGKRDDKWRSFLGKLNMDGAIQYQDGQLSYHNTATHWTSLDHNGDLPSNETT